MDTDEETKRFKAMLVVGILFLISAYFTWKELKYAVFAKKADASIVRVYESTESGRRGRTRQVQVIEYQFDDKGAVRKESDTISKDSPAPAGKTVAIQYLSGTKDSSRLAGKMNMIPVLMFVGCLAFIGFNVWKLLQESKR